MLINEKTYVPLLWMVVSFFAVSSILVSGSFWVRGVNDRLQRIEEKLDSIKLASKGLPCDEEIEHPVYALNNRTMKTE